MSSERRDWSFVTREEFERYFAAAQSLIEHARDQKIHPFAAALAGVAFIRSALQTMGGRVEWWIDFVRTGNLPGLEFPSYGPPSQNPPRA